MLIALSHTLKGFLIETSATKIIQKALTALDCHFHADYSYLALQDKDTAYIDIKYSHGLSRTTLQKFHKRVGSNTIGRLFFKDTFTVIKSSEHNLDDYNELKIDDDYKMCVAMPIGWGGRTIGYVSCYFDFEFEIDLSMRNFFLSMAGACSAALEKEELLKTISELRQFDAETGIYSHLFFLSKLEEEMFQSHMHKKPMSLVVMDMDNYKKVLNTYGGDSAHALLKATAEELKSHISGSDVLGSLGLDEFIMYMPNTQIGKAAEIIGNYCEKLKTLKFTEDNIDTSFSFGITELRADGDDIEKLMQRAQLALYDARKKGRGQLCLQP